MVGFPRFPAGNDRHVSVAIQVFVRWPSRLAVAPDPSSPSRRIQFANTSNCGRRSRVKRRKHRVVLLVARFCRVNACSGSDDVSRVTNGLTTAPLRKSSWHR